MDNDYYNYLTPARRARIELAAEHARGKMMEALDTALARAFPDAEEGGTDPLLDFELEHIIERFIWDWATTNVPDLRPEE